MKDTIKKSVDFFKLNNENYDHRWISLYGMEVIKSSYGDDSAKYDIIEPENKRAEIKAKIIDDFNTSLSKH